MPFLPPEIHWLIIEELDDWELMSVARVSREFKDIALKTLKKRQTDNSTILPTMLAESFAKYLEMAREGDDLSRATDAVWRLQLPVMDDLEETIHLVPRLNSICMIGQGNWIALIPSQISKLHLVGFTFDTTAIQNLIFNTHMRRLILCRHSIEFSSFSQNQTFLSSLLLEDVDISEDDTIRMLINIRETSANFPQGLSTFAFNGMFTPAIIDELMLHPLVRMGCRDSDVPSDLFRRLSNVVFWNVGKQRKTLVRFFNSCNAETLKGLFIHYHDAHKLEMPSLGLSKLIKLEHLVLKIPSEGDISLVTLKRLPALKHLEIWITNATIAVPNSGARPRLIYRAGETHVDRTKTWLQGMFPGVKIEVTTHRTRPRKFFGDLFPSYYY